MFEIDVRLFCNYNFLRYFNSFSIPPVEFAAEMLEPTEVPQHVLSNFSVKSSKHDLFVLC